MSFQLLPEQCVVFRFGFRPCPDEVRSRHEDLPPFLGEADVRAAAIAAPFLGQEPQLLKTAQYFAQALAAHAEKGREIGDRRGLTFCRSLQCVESACGQPKLGQPAVQPSLAKPGRDTDQAVGGPLFRDRAGQQGHVPRSPRGVLLVRVLKPPHWLAGRLRILVLAAHVFWTLSLASLARSLTSVTAPWPSALTCSTPSAAAVLTLSMASWAGSFRS